MFHFSKDKGKMEGRREGGRDTSVSHFSVCDSERGYDPMLFST
jgi:hypothetical protein